MSSQQDERRQFFRIDDSLSLGYRQISVDSLPASVERLENELDSDFTVVSSLAAVSQEMMGTLHKIEASRPEIAAYLKSLDKKIDILGRALLAQTTELLSKPTQSVNISATGISFAVDEYIEPGAILELKILLMPSYAGILSFAEVVGCEPVEQDVNKPDKRYQLRTAFAHIRERDRDVLIQHVIQRQGAQLRQAREAQEQMQLEQKE
ncbi:PilZ domain-containing protein [Sedimenticola sp.]|uniref:PilZ domain-containing protein n=1 Tax=Sedimenticola sp. TaxID=1940285 RepID=UPI003D14A850